MTQRALPRNRPNLALASRQCSVIVMLGVICCGTALGASSPMAACDRAVELQSLEVRVSDLSAITVGHAIVDPKELDEATIDVPPTHDQSDVPILDLAPRVAVILQDVFSAVAIQTVSLDSLEQPVAIESPPAGESPLSPVAGDTSQPDSVKHTNSASDIENVDAAPSVRRQMFRTDI